MAKLRPRGGRTRAKRLLQRARLGPALRHAGGILRGALAVVVRPRVRTLFVLMVVGVPLVVAFVVARFLTSVLWFQELGQEDAYARMTAAQALLVVVAGGVTTLFLAGNAWFAISRAPSSVASRSLPAVFAGCALVGAIIGWSARGSWQLALLWAHGQSFGVEDPLHHRDIGYFVFSLPFLEKVSNLLLLLVAMGLVLAIVAHRLTRALTWRPLAASYPARVHLAVLGSLALFALAWRLHLQTFSAELQQTPAGGKQAFPGPHYVDVHVRMLGFSVLSYVALACAIGVAAAPFVAARGRGRLAKRLAILPVPALGIVALVSLSWAPAFVQRYVVDPDPVAKEGPFLQNALAGTRAAFELADVNVHPVVPKARITSADLRRHRPSLDNIQLWDTEILRGRMEQLASDTPYYRPAPPTYDAVPVRHRSRITLIGDRELDISRVRGAGRGWANNRLAYTHGYGAFRFSGTRIGRTGGPQMNNRASPLRQPRIYFGRQQAGAPDWVVADTRRREFDRPTAEGAARPYHYLGSGGIPLSSRFRRAAFALRLNSLPLLVSKELTSRSRIILHRGVLDRLRTLAPFIRWDPSPAAMVVGGRIVFLAAGYTTSRSYPYAQRIRMAGSGVSYARAAVQATVDAYSGRVRLYAADREDPILRAWTAAFPEMFEPISRMPTGIRERLRYPPALFDAQAQLYRRFHVTRPQSFASGADAWSMPTALSGPIEVAADIRFDESDEDELRSRMEPAYRFAAPAGEERARVLRSVYYSPRSAQNLVAGLDGWLDRRGVPKLSARSLPRDRVTLGPAQVSRLVNLTPRIANSLDVRNRELRDVGKSSLDSIWLGNPHIVFLAGGIMQVQSIYDGSNGRGIARMYGITVFLNGRAGLGNSLDAALRQALNLPPAVEFERLPRRMVAGRPVPIRFHVTNGLTEMLQIRSGDETAFSRRLRLRSGRALVRWVPRKPGRVRVRVLVRGVDGSLVSATTAGTVRPAPTGGGPPTVEFTGLRGGPVVGRPVRIGFRVTNATDETVRIESPGGDALTWELRVRNGRGAVEWVPRDAGRVRVEILVRGAERRTVEAATNLTVRRRGSRSARGP